MSWQSDVDKAERQLRWLLAGLLCLAAATGAVICWAYLLGGL